MDGFDWEDENKKGGFSVYCELMQEALGRAFVGFEECLIDIAEGIVEAWV